MNPEHSPLGKATVYAAQYDASLLFPIPRVGECGTRPVFRRTEAATGNGHTRIQERQVEIAREETRRRALPEIRFAQAPPERNWTESHNSDLLRVAEIAVGHWKIIRQWAAVFLQSAA